MQLILRVHMAYDDSRLIVCKLLYYRIQVCVLVQCTAMLETLF